MYEGFWPSLVQDTTRLDAFVKSLCPSSRPYILTDWSQDIELIAIDVPPGAVRARWICLNSCLLSFGGEDDNDNLCVSSSRLEDSLLGGGSSDYVFVAVHHPIPGWLAPWNRKDIKRLLERSNRGVDLLLHGHLHETSGGFSQTLAGTELLTIGAGAAYQESPFPRAFSILDVDPDAGVVRPTIFRYNPTPNRWEEDNSLSYPLNIKKKPNIFRGTRPSSQRGPEATEDFEYVIPLFAKYAPTPLPSGIRAKLAVQQLLAFLNPAPPANSAAETTSDLLRLLLEHRRIALEGSSGSGKTTTLRQIEASLLRRRDSAAPIVPLLIDIHDWVGSEVPFHKWLQRYRFELGIGQVPSFQLAVLIDGIQQFDDGELSDHQDMIHSILEKMPETYCIVTARSFPLDAIPQSHFLVARLEPLSGTQVQAFLDSYLEPTLAEKFRRWLSHFEIPGTARQQLFEDIVRNPLRLSILLSVYAVVREKTAHAIGQLLLMFFTIVFEREKATHGCADATLDEMIEWIGPIALKLVTNPRIDNFRLVGKTERERAFERLSIGSEIIGPANIKTRIDSKFCHTLVRDFFAAMYITKAPNQLVDVLRPPQFRNGNRITTPLDDVLRLLASLEGASRVFGEVAAKDPVLLLELSLSIPDEIIGVAAIESAWPGICTLLTSKTPAQRYVALELCRRSAVRIRELLPTTYANTGNPALRKICLHLAWNAGDVNSLKLICRAISDVNRTVRREAREIFVGIANEDPVGAVGIAQSVIDSFIDMERDFWRSSFSSVAGVLDFKAREIFSDLVPISSRHINREKVPNVWQQPVWLPSFSNQDLGGLSSEFVNLVSRLAFCDALEAVRVLTGLREFAYSHLEKIHLLAESGNLVLARRLPRLMAYVQDPRSIDVLIRLLRIPQPRVIEHALKALSSFHRSDIAEGSRLFCYSPEPRVRIQAVRLMISQGGSDEHLLLNFLSDPRWEIRCAAVQALGREGTDQSVIRCLDLLSDREQGVRIAVCQIADRVGQRAIARIRTCMIEDKRVPVKRHALRALTAIDPAEGCKEAAALLLDPRTPDLLAATALEELLRVAPAEFEERLLTVGRTLSGASVKKVIQEWETAKEVRNDVALDDAGSPTPGALGA